MSDNDSPLRKLITAILKRRKAIWLVLGLGTIGTIITTYIEPVLTLPGKINQFIVESPVLREKWLNATQWAGIYSSNPEGVVDMEDLDLSREFDVTISLNYSNELHSITGYIHSDTFCKRGLFYRNVLLKGSPDIWAPNRLDLDVFEIMGGHTIILDKIRIERDGPQGIITVTSIESNGRLLSDTLRLAPDSELIEEELDFLCLDLWSFLAPKKAKDSATGQDHRMTKIRTAQPAEQEPGPRIMPRPGNLHGYRSSSREEPFQKEPMQAYAPDSSPYRKHSHLNIQIPGY